VLAYGAAGNRAPGVIGAYLTVSYALAAVPT